MSTTFDFKRSFPIWLTLPISRPQGVAGTVAYQVSLACPLSYQRLETDEQITDPTRVGNAYNPCTGDEPYEVVHTTAYRVHERVAKQYQVGRAFLVGDAAHISNPLGGMGEWRHSRCGEPCRETDATLEGPYSVCRRSGTVRKATSQGCHRHRTGAGVKEPTDSQHC